MQSTVTVLKKMSPLLPVAHIDITFSVDGIERLYEEVLNKSIEMIQPLRDMPYGREFYIADPDGNHLAFIETT
jgi:predicted enzyme related to lactoylglutathione lyase